MKKILIIGALSAIAQATARQFAESGDALFLVARDQSKLNVLVEDLRVRGAASVESALLDVLDYDQHQPTLEAAIAAMEGVDIALLAHGTLPHQKACEDSFEVAKKEFEVNAISSISLLTHIANYFEQKKAGTIVAISSVAGDRGRQSNYLYGSAKGALTLFLQGLRNRLYKSGVAVITIKPGFVDTPMTAEFTKGALWAKPEKIAECIVQSINKKRDVVYAPWFWQIIMLVIKLVPETIFKRLSL
ncbi:MAG: SDR family oxidoreductase [Candidatus Polarisedimenticolaceae bacterium]|nr:SDR family oxidoreductase [Candidatus Polarisedimenticolaceae bacterium]